MAQDFDRYDLSLDEILCDDRIAVQFDSIAAQFAPGYTPFEYRWGGAQASQRGMNARTRAKNYRKELKVRKLSDGVSLQELDLNQVPEGPGLYGIATAEERPKFLYAGEATQLRSRMRRHFETEQLRGLWQLGSEGASVFYCPVPTIDDYRLARQSVLLSWYRPAWNIVDLLST